MAHIGKQGHKKSSPEWMTTYSDMVSLLLCFFVLLFAMSSINEEKFKAMAEAFAGKQSLLPGGSSGIIGQGSNSGILPDFPISVPSDSEGEGGETADKESPHKELFENFDISRIVSDFQTYLAHEDISAGITVEQAGEYLRIRFPDGLLFDSGQADLKPEASAILDVIIEELDIYPNTEIRIEGHTDNVPISTPRFPDNIYLSSARADTVFLYFISKGVDPVRLSAEGKSEYWPIADNSTAEGRAQNRRVEIKVYAILED